MGTADGPNGVIEPDLEAPVCIGQAWTRYVSLVWGVVSTTYVGSLDTVAKDVPKLPHIHLLNCVLDMQSGWSISNPS
jgi:hypothetical protein